MAGGKSKAARNSKSESNGAIKNTNLRKGSKRDDSGEDRSSRSTENRSKRSKRSVDETQPHDHVKDKEYGAEEAEAVLVLRDSPEIQNKKFDPDVVSQIIESVIKEQLANHVYSKTEVLLWAKSISDTIKERTKAQNFHRCKLIVTLIVGERKEQGISSAVRCLWDAETDNAASYNFINDTMFCIGRVFGVYMN